MRAPRFPLHLSAAYRPVGAAEWRSAETENISRSGVLFRAAEPMPLGAEVEFRLKLPAFGPATPEVTCRGRVVRVVSPAHAHAMPGSAIAIEHYDFVPATGAGEGFLPLSSS